MDQRDRTYFKNFDGLRFGAALTVICAHYVTVFSPIDSSIGKWQKIILTVDGSGADAGVSFFFVLSGFLITYLILTAPDSRSLRYIWLFYARRILRIWPLYYLTLLIGFLVFPRFADVQPYVELADWRMYALFLANVDQVRSGNSNLLLGVHWSVSVEEQFYLLWPWALFLFRSLTFFVCVLILSFLVQLFIGHQMHTIGSFHDLAMGAGLAYLCFTFPSDARQVFFRLGRPGVVGFYLLGILIVVGRFQLTQVFPGYEAISGTVNALVFCFVVMDQGFNLNCPFPVSKLPMVSYLGKISYGLYLLHPVAILIVKLLLFDLVASWLVLPCIVATSIAISALSYHLFERFFLRLKTRVS